MNTIVIFYLTIGTEMLLGISLILTITVSDFRVWPPPSRRSWQYWFTWSLTDIAFIGTVIVGIMDWNSAILEHWIRIPVGILLIIVGLIVILWGVNTLSTHMTLGFEGELITSGPYRYTRNPQYLGDIAILIGYGILSNSWMAMVCCLVGILWFVLAPYVEEPWLIDKYGDSYEAYMCDVPRFISLYRNK